MPLESYELLLISNTLLIPVNYPQPTSNFFFSVFYIATRCDLSGSGVYFDVSLEFVCQTNTFSKIIKENIGLFDCFWAFYILAFV